MNKEIEQKSAIKQELVGMGFLEEHVNLALNVCNNQEEAVDLIIKMLENEDFYNVMKQNANAKKYGDDLSLKQYKMTIVVRKDLNMSIGKIASQVGHGVLDAYKEALRKYPKYVEIWENSGSKKVVLGVNSLSDIIKLKEKALSQEIPFSVISDAGRTEVEPGSITVIAVGPAPNNLVDIITGNLELLK